MKYTRHLHLVHCLNMHTCSTCSCTSWSKISWYAEPVLPTCPSPVPVYPYQCYPNDWGCRHIKQYSHSMYYNVEEVLHEEVPICEDCITVLALAVLDFNATSTGRAEFSQTNKYVQQETKGSITRAQMRVTACPRQNQTIATYAEGVLARVPFPGE